MYGTLLILHVLAATIWTGGHIVLALVVLPRVLKDKAPQELLKFESAYEYLGMPALLIQIVTGFMLVHHMLPDVEQWLNFKNPILHVLAAKIILLLFTAALAIDAQLRVLPKLSEKNLWDMAWHIIAVTIMSVLFVVVGVSVRTGWLY